MEEQKQKIVDGAKQYSEYITGRIPQVDERGKVKYYFSGSLALLLLNSATHVKALSLDVDGYAVKLKAEFIIPDKNKESLAKGVRPISMDVDVVAVDDKYFANKGSIYMLSNIRKKCNLATTLCPKWESFCGSYFDWLEGDREFKSHGVAQITLQDGSRVLIADPITLALHKLADGIKCKQILRNLARKGKLTQENQERLDAKYQKDIRDYTSLFNGVVALYPKTNWKKIISHCIETCPDSAFAGIMASNSSEDIKQFYLDAKDQINDEYLKLFTELISAIGKENKAILDKQSAR